MKRSGVWSGTVVRAPLPAAAYGSEEGIIERFCSQGFTWIIHQSGRIFLVKKQRMLYKGHEHWV